jgi:hypothetical protein
MDRAKQRSSSRHQLRLCGVTFAATDRRRQPGHAFAETRGFISPIKKSTSSLPADSPRLRIKGNALEGFGGNAAVLTGTDGRASPGNRPSPRESIELGLRRST